MNLGIDKIALTGTDFQANNLEKFTTSSIKKPDAEVPFLIQDKTGKDHFGNKAFLQTENTIIDISQRGILIAFNPCKALHPYKLNNNLEKITELVKQEVKASGIDTDIEAMNLCRIDLTKQAEMKQPVHVYNDAFNYLKGKRLTSKSYPSGYNFGNKSTEAVFYDKRAELIAKSKLNIPESNFMRCEVKGKNTKSVRTITGINNYKTLLRIEPEHLDKSYNEYLSGKVFNRMKLGEQLTLNFQNEAEILQSFIEANSRSGINKYLMTLGIESALELFGSLEGFQRLLEAVNVPRSTIYRTIANLNKQVQQKAFLDARRGIDTVASRLYEVQEVFTKVA